MRGGYWTNSSVGNLVTREYVPDYRAVYVGAVNSLHDVLLPHFDKEMTADSETYDTELDKIYKKYCSALVPAKTRGLTPSQKYKQFYVDAKLELNRLLFQSLNQLLKRIDYLKTAIYEEGDLDDEGDAA